jgi:hypothetical protein
MEAIRPVFLRGRLPARQDAHDEIRGRMQAVGVDEVEHRDWHELPRRRVDETPHARKSNLRKTHEHDTGRA